jgi:hypothetical protein
MVGQRNLALEQFIALEKKRVLNLGADCLKREGYLLFTIRPYKYFLFTTNYLKFHLNLYFLLNSPINILDGIYP